MPKTTSARKNNGKAARPHARVRRSYVWAGLFMLAIAAWFVSGDVIIGGQGGGAARETPALAPIDAAERRFRVRTRTIAAEPRDAVLVVRGRTEADARVEVRSETAGIVEALPVSKGASVARGDVLCELETGARAAALHEAEALLAQAEADHEASSQLAERGHGAKLRVAADRARLDGARAALERARIEHARTRLLAPFAGIVEDQPVRIGSYLNVGDVCARLVAMDPLLVVGSVSEREIGRLKKGMAGTATLVTGESADGAVTFIAPAADPRTRTFRIELEIPNPGGALRDGVTSDIRLPIASEVAHKLSPAALTLNDAGQVGVRTVEDGDTVRFVPVTLLGEADDGVWVSGLPQTAQVITVGQEFVAEGQKVEAVDQSGVAAK